MTAKEFYTIFLRNPQVCTDSRNITPGCLFFALTGDSFNGNLFAADALSSGASFAVVDDPAVVSGSNYTLVKNVLEFLQELASFHRSQLNIPVVALTGTNGKTTTKELIQSVLKQQYRVVGTSGNLNNHIGVPLTLLSAGPETEILVVEMGANHPGEIAFLCDIARPTHGLITNVGKAHLEGFGSFDGVVVTKSELFRFVSRTGGTWFLNSDDEHLSAIAGDYPSITYGSDGSPSVKGIAEAGGYQLAASVSLPDQSEFVAKTSLTGNYNLYNVLAAAAVGYQFGMSAVKIRAGIEGYMPSNMRSQWKVTAGNRLLLDAYNANPSSMALAIRHFASLNLPMSVLILGDMFELGNESAVEHAEIVRLVRTFSFHAVYLAGKEFFNCARGPGLQAFPDTESLIAELQRNPLQGCTILVKGSRGMKLEKSLDYL